MKNFTKILLVMFCLVTIHNPLFSQAPTNGLVAYYPFTGNPNDASGYGRNGVTSGGIALTTDRYGNSGQAYLFNGSNAGIAVNSWNTITGNTPRTMSIWFKTTNPSVSQQVLSWGTNSASSSCYMGSGIYSGIKFLGFFGFANDLALVDAFQFYDNRWHLMTFTFDGSTMTLFFDGVAFMSRTGATLNTGSSRLTIGFHYTNVDYFNGSLDDIRIYNRALSVTEVQQTYLAEVASSTTIDIMKLGSDKFIHATGIGNTYVGLRTGAFSSGQNNTFLGFRVGLNSSGINNTFLGTDAGSKNTTGGFNTFTGSQAGFLTTTGTENTFNGYYSGYSNTTGSFNSLYGRNSGAYLTSGENNTFLGFSSGFSANGNKNVMIGRDAGAWATTGSENVFIGWASGTGIQVNPNTGISNTFMGSLSGQFNTTGSYSTFLGYASGNKNTTGIANTFTGTGSGFNNTIGSRNTFNGYNSGLNMLTGNDNVFMGWFAGYSILGSENVAVGRGAGTWATIGSGNVFMGKDAGEGSSTVANTGDYNTFLGTQAGNKNSTGSYGTFIGYSAGNKNSTGLANTFTGTGSGSNNTIGSRNTFNGYNSGLNMLTGNDNVFLGWFSGYSTLSDNNVAIGRGSGTWATTGPGNVLIGKDAGEGSSTVANTGENNTFLGTEAGNKNSSGSNNVFLGYRAGSGSILNSSGSFNLYLGNLSGGFGLNGATLQRSVAIGYNAKVSINDAIILGDTANTNLKVGIGTTRPGNSFELRSAVPNTSGLRLTNLTSNSPTLTGNSKALTVNNLGDIILVPMSGGGANTHSDSAFVRTLANTNFVGGNLGIGVATPQYKLDVNGDIRIGGSGSLAMQGGIFMRNFDSASGNTSIGYDSGGALNNSSGIANTFLGKFAGRLTNSGWSNTFIGRGAGIINTTGYQNVYLGYQSGANVSTGNANTFIGYNANSIGANAEILQYSTAIGYNATVSVNNAIVLGDYTNTSLKVGIGMHDPQFKLDVKGPINIRGINGGLGELKFMTHNFLQGDKNFNSAIGFLSEVDSQYVHSTAIGYKSYATANNVLVLGGVGENSVNVGIGNSAPQSILEITSKNEGESGLMFTNLTQNFMAKHSNNKFLSVDEKGKVGLYNLSADQITLKINNPNEWSDKVFASNYPLMSIDKVENFIKTEGHLPNIPSAKEMTEKGISTQEMFAKLLEKNEELMLYVLEQNKMNTQQAKEIEELKKEIQKLKNK
jgi:trimeric autotransporter adhesin